MPPSASASSSIPAQTIARSSRIQATSSRSSMHSSSSPAIPILPPSPTNHNCATDPASSPSSGSSFPSTTSSSHAGTPSSFFASQSQQPFQSHGKPKRPPNAWIIFRSDMLRALANPKPGEPKPKQSDMSKIISTMWHNKTDEVAQKYERMAESAKRTHELMFPGYQFCPVKKEEKERLRKEEKKAKAKARDAEKEAKRRSRVSYVPTHDGVGSAERDNLPMAFDPMLYSPPISCANTPEPVHDDLPSPRDESSPLTVGDAEPLSHPLPSLKGKEPQRSQSPSFSLPEMAHHHPENPFLPGVVEDPATRFAPDTQPGNLDGLNAEYLDLGSFFDWDPCLKTAAHAPERSGVGSPIGAGPTFDNVEELAGPSFLQPIGFDASQLQSPFSYPIEKATDNWDRPSPLSSSDQQFDSGLLYPHHSYSDNLLPPSPASYYHVPEERAQQRPSRLPPGDSLQDALDATNGFGPDFAKDFLTEQTESGQFSTSFGHDRMSISFQDPPLPSQYPYESSSTPGLSSSPDDSPASHVPKRRRFSPSGDHQLTHAGAHDDTSLGHNFAPPLARTDSAELTHLLGTQLSTGDGYVTSSYHSSKPVDNAYLSPVEGSSSFDSSLTQPSMSRKRRYPDF